MGFFRRKRDELIKRGYDPARLPPGQYLTDGFPALHAGDPFREQRYWGD